MESLHLAKRQKDWVNIVFLTLTPVLGLPVLIWYTLHVGFAWWMAGLFLALYSLVGLSICAGYHRHFAHRTYECSPIVESFYAVFGALAAQNSILQWSSGHRRHHTQTETDWDPYSIARGFWWAHCLWIFYVDPDGERFENVRDLERNAIVRWQHRWYRALLMGGGFGLPLAIGWCFGDPLAGLLWGGFLRIAAVHHSTFFVNSLAHRFGARTYNEAATARDNWAVAFLTFGEGYHSFHHRFPGDFRNGIRWYAWDPAKWFVSALEFMKLASNLRVTPAARVGLVRMQVAAAQLAVRIAHAEPSRAAQVRERIERARQAFDEAMALWAKYLEERRQGLSDRWRETRRSYHARLNQARTEWRCALAAVRQC